MVYRTIGWKLQDFCRRSVCSKLEQWGEIVLRRGLDGFILFLNVINYLFESTPDGYLFVDLFSNVMRKLIILFKFAWSKKSAFQVGNLPELSRLTVRVMLWQWISRSAQHIARIRRFGLHCYDAKRNIMDNKTWVWKQHHTSFMKTLWFDNRSGYLPMRLNVNKFYSPHKHF